MLAFDLLASRQQALASIAGIHIDRQTLRHRKPKAMLVVDRWIEARSDVLAFQGRTEGWGRKTDCENGGDEACCDNVFHRLSPDLFCCSEPLRPDWSVGPLSSGD